MAAAACALTEIGENSPAIHFDNIAGFTDARVAMNVHGSWCNHALALGMEKDASMRDQFFEFVRRFQLYPGALERVESAPWQEVVIEKDVNLFEILPLFRLNRGDGGYFIDKACTSVATLTIGTMTMSKTSAYTVCRSRDRTAWESRPCRSTISQSTWRMRKSAVRTCRLRSRWGTSPSLP